MVDIGVPGLLLLMEELELDWDTWGSKSPACGWGGWNPSGCWNLGSGGVSEPDREELRG